ncbi:MAG: HD domain-containing protein [Oscillospiraceae bacterium]|nr:HD domain-containing protein [Oscillospiraceae bacterium]
MADNIERMKKQLDFLLELDKMKNIYRRTYILCDDLPAGSKEFEDNFKERKPLPRRENDAEHSFSLAVAALVLAEYSNEPVDTAKVVKMVLVHDVVEIDAGDTFLYDAEGNKTKREREAAAAERIFGLLPPDQQAEFRCFWDEFEANNTPESRFANALDRIQPMLLNYTRDGISWKEHNVRFDDVAERNSHIKDGSEELWDYVYSLLEDANSRGILPR